MNIIMDVYKCTYRTTTQLLYKVQMHFFHLINFLVKFKEAQEQVQLLLCELCSKNNQKMFILYA